ncbi:MAG: multicopper oxidase domain-containing protein [Bacteroidota bacterium]|nr:multicopper oxidase domain-containing protein [Bacteroidota bacterium]
MLLFAFTTTGAATIKEKVFINRGIYTAVDGNTFPMLAFNSTSTFEPVNKVFIVTSGDNIEFNIHNNDSSIHEILIPGESLPVKILPGDSGIISIALPDGLYLLQDAARYPAFGYMGLSAMISVSSHSGPEFYWNLKEQQSEWNRRINQGQSVDFNNYDPDHYTINGLTHPAIMSDTLAVVRGKVGDTIRIYIANSGLSVHSIHFHGYHCTVKYTSSTWVKTGWSKDTFPIDSMETLILELVPDKPGEYPVHDHNLIALTSGDTHPNGMMVHIIITP